MDEYILFYHGAYSRGTDFSSHYLWQSKLLFTPESPKPLSESPKTTSPGKRREEQRRRLYVRILKQLNEADLPGKDHAVDYLSAKFRRNCKAGTLASSGTAVRFFLTFIKCSGKERLVDIDRHDIEARIPQQELLNSPIHGISPKTTQFFCFQAQDLL